jgi:hypothetical protein
MKSLKQACKPRPSVFEFAKRDTVHTIEDLLKNRVDPTLFFEENYLTAGMKELLEKGFRRLEGNSEQGVFKLCQAMGGGKTHNLIALGLLAKYPEFRNQVMSSFYKPRLLGSAKVIAFNGRDSDCKYGIWGELAKQLDKFDELKDYYSPFKAPGQSTWTKLLQGQPLIIMLDELPPYLDGARAVAVANSDLAHVTAEALANLFVAVQENLPNVCLVLSDLTHSYEDGRTILNKAMDKILSEAKRAAYDLHPVQLNSDEFYHILRKRLFAELPDVTTITEIAQGFADSLKDHKAMALTNATPEQLASDIKRSYPFHPSLKDLFARFRENSGFQQTRGIIRLLRAMAAGLWSDEKKDPYLLAPYHIDLNDEEQRKQIVDIHSSLQNAISHDIAHQGSAIAEREGPDAVDTANLLLMSSLATVANAVRGLSEPEIIHYLAAPGRRLADLRQSVLEPLRNRCWYLHSTNDQKLFFKDEQNFAALLQERASNYTPEHYKKEIETKLKEFFTPELKVCYQELLLFKPLDEIHLSKDKVTLLIASKWNKELEDFWYEQTYFNRLCVLCGTDQTRSDLHEAACQYKALLSILEEFRQQRYSENEPCMKEARSQHDRILQNFHSALRETYSKLYYPRFHDKKQEVASTEFRMEFVANKFDGEKQVITTLEGRQKYFTVKPFDTLAKLLEARLFTRASTPWAEILDKAATNAAWQWHPPRLLEQFKEDALRRGHWRERAGNLQKGPFEDPTEVVCRELERDEENGVATLEVKPLQGDQIYYREEAGDATTQDKLLSGEILKTSALSVSFLAIDSKGKTKTGVVYRWNNHLVIKAITTPGQVSFHTIPAIQGIEIRYTLDGSSPRTNGHIYKSPILVNEPIILQAIARYGNIESNPISRNIAARDLEKGFESIGSITTPCLWKLNLKRESTEQSYLLLNTIKNHSPIVQGFTIEVRGGGRRYVSLQGGGEYSLEATDFIEELERLHKSLPEGSLSVKIQELLFKNGIALEAFADELRIEPNLDQIQQLKESA